VLGTSITNSNTGLKPWGQGTFHCGFLSHLLPLLPLGYVTFLISPVTTTFDSPGCTVNNQTRANRRVFLLDRCVKGIYKIRNHIPNKIVDKRKVGKETLLNMTKLIYRISKSHS
jgi:hypothetical protein